MKSPSNVYVLTPNITFITSKANILVFTIPFLPLSNSKSETVKYYNENPGAYNIVYSTDMIEDYVSNIIELLKQEEE